MVVVELLELPKTQDIDGGIADEATTAQQQMQDPLWLPPEIAKASEAKCEPEIQASAFLFRALTEVCLMTFFANVTMVAGQER